MTVENEKPSRERLRWQPYRSQHRARSDEQAHADALEEALPPVPDHPLVPAAFPSVAANDAELSVLIEQLRQHGSFGYDSEFIGEHTYYPRLCVIQVATADQVTLVDPMAGLDMSPFWQLLADDAVQKIVHCGRKDLEPVVRAIDQPPRNVFDTQITAAFAGLNYPSSLGRLVLDLVGVDHWQGPKFSQWDRRPLSPVQLQYAANDVRFLPLLHDAIAQQLDVNGNQQWAEEECQALCELTQYQLDARSQRIRSRDAETLSRLQYTVLRELVAWREQLAIEHDVPPRAMIKDDVLVFLSRGSVKTVEDLRSVRDLPRPIRETYGQAIIDVIQAGRLRPAWKGWDRRAPPDRDLVEKLWLNVQEVCQAHSIHPAIATSKKELTKYLSATQGGKPVLNHRLANGWRNELLGPVLTQAVGQ